MRRLLALLPIGLISCTHGESYRREIVAPNPIRTTTPPRQMTFSTEGDWAPVWLPDGSAFGYSYHVLGRHDRDRCLGFLPPEGGRIGRSICVRAGQEWDSANVVSYHAVSPGGRLALIGDAGLTRLFAPAARNLYLGRIDRDPAPRPVMAFPYSAATGQQHYTAMNLTWIGESTLVFLATFVNYVEGKVGVPADTVHIGIEIVRLELAGDSIASRHPIPGTLGVTSLCRGTRPNTVAFTQGASSAVFELDLGTGQVSPLYDFAPLGIARDVQIAGGRIVAVAGGRATYVPFSLVFNGLPYLADSGGPVYSAQLPDGAPQVVVDTVGEHQFRRPALSPSGRRLVVEEFGFEFKDYGNQIRYVVSKQADLWLFEVP